MNAASRASSTNASSHLVTSKHNTKCRRVPRIISRRLYCYRRKTAFQTSKLGFCDRSRKFANKDFSPELRDLSTLGETILNFLVKYPNRRSYSTDSDPLVQLRKEMNKSAYFNHNLMKRRYSVPETIMRKHKLQELLSKKSAETASTSKPHPVKDESCQTDEIYPRKSSQKKPPKRKRDGFRYFKKSNTYCQYKNFLSQKKKYRDIKSGSSATDTIEPYPNQYQSTTSLPALVDGNKKCCEFSKQNLVRQISAPSSNEEFEKLMVPKSKTSHPSNRQLLAPDNNVCCDSRCRLLHPIRQSSAPSSSENEKRAPAAGKLFESPKRVHIKNCKSLDQNTSGYNTICGSLDEYTTPRKKTPEGSKIPIIEEQEDHPKTKGYPITFHSESVFLHPCQEGFISHKEFHHISIQMVPEKTAQQQRTESEAKNDYYKTEIKLNVNDANDQSSNSDVKNEEEVSKGQPDVAKSHLTTPRNISTHVPMSSSISHAYFPAATTEKHVESAPQSSPSPRQPDHQPSTTNQIVLFDTSDHNNAEYEDCSVPTTYPFKVDKSNLKIEVDVGNVDIPSNLHDILVSHKTPRSDQNADQSKPKDDSRYNSKAALNYLFQKLGDSYPRRYLLKKPVFEKKPQFGKYYSELPKPEGADIPPRVLYNNQTYDILSANLLPNEWSNVSIGTDANDHHSDSDISIPDSLEDFQQTKYKYNKYHKYDEKLTRGDAPAKTNAKPSKHKGVAYFIPLLDSNKTKPIMPAELKKKLSARNENLSKHSSCTDVAKKSPRNKAIHKQVQTCLNVDDSLKKRRKKFADGKTKSDKQDLELDERIKNILLSGISNVGDPKQSRYLVQHPSETSTQSVQTENMDPTMNEYVEMFNMASPSRNEHTEFFDNGNLYEIILSEEEVGRTQTNNFYRSFKKCRRIYYPNKIPDSHRSQEETHHSSYQENSNVPSFSGYQKKLKEFKQQIKKQNSDTKGITYPRPEPTNELLPLPYPRLKKGREKQKSKSISKIPGPKRFYQKFEAIPEELTNSSEGVFDFHENLTANNSDENNESTPDPTIEDFNQESSDSARRERSEKNSNREKSENMNKSEKEYDENCNVKRPNPRESGQDKNSDNRKELKSRKGRDSLSGMNEQEELITLSKGWINFYLLKGHSTEENNSAPEDAEDENIAISETIQIPQQYSVHIQARPEVTTPNGTKIHSTLPGLYKSTTKKNQKSEKNNPSHDTSLPEITNSSVNQGKNTAKRTTGKCLQLQSMLPKSHYSGGQSNIANGKPQIHRSRSSEPVGFHRDPTKTENSISTVTTSSNHSESPSEEPSGRNSVKKIQRYQRPHTYHSGRTSSSRGDHWSLTLKGSHNVRRPSADIEMQLSLKNAPNQHPNHSWKFTLKSENAEMSHTTGSVRRNINGAYLPHLNVNYKMLPSPTYQEEYLTASFSENNSESNSTLSYSGRKYKLDSELLLQNVTKLNNDLKFQIRKSDEDLTIKGSAITPERKPRVPTMSERDLTRMRMIRQTSADNRFS